MIGTLKEEIAKLSAAANAGVVGLGAREQVVLQLVDNYISSKLISATTNANGEIVIPGMTVTGAVVVTAMENVELFYAVAATGKIVIKAQDDDAAIANKKFGVVVVALS